MKDNTFYFVHKLYIIILHSISIHLIIWLYKKAKIPHTTSDRVQTIVAKHMQIQS